MNVPLTAKQKFIIMQSLDCKISLRLNVNQKWYVCSQFEVGGDGLLKGEHGRGETPELAIEEHFRIYCETLPKDRYVRCNKENWRWSGFHWERIEKNA